MEYVHLRSQLADMRKALLDEELLDEQFVMMEDVEEVGRKNIVERCMVIYFYHCTESLDQLEKILMNDRIDFEVMHTILSKLKRESNIVGASKVAIKAADMKKKPQGDISRIKQALEDLKEEVQTLRNRIEPYFHLLRQVGPADAAERPIQDNSTST